MKNLQGPLQPGEACFASYRGEVVPAKFVGHGRSAYECSVIVGGLLYKQFSVKRVAREAEALA